MSTEALPPGGEGEIKATLKTKGRKGVTKKTITVHSNDPETPQLTLTLEGEIEVDVAVEPARLSFGEISKRSHETREVRIDVTNPEQVKITKVALADDQFELKLKDGDAAADSTYEVVFKGAKKLGRLQSKLRVEFSGSNIDHIEVPLWGQVVGDLRYPQQLSFHKDKNGRFTERKLDFSSRSDQQVHVLNAEDPDGHLKVEVVQAQGKLAKLSLTVAKPDDQASKPVRGKLKVTTTDQDEPEIEIPYSIHYQRGRLANPLASRPPRPGH